MKLDFLGYAGGTLLSLQMVPQIIKVHRQRDASQLSLGFMMCNWVGLSCMTAYGVVNQDPPLYVPTGISLFNTCILIFQKFVYDYSKHTTLEKEQTEDTLHPERFPLSFSPGTPPRSHPVDISPLNQHRTWPKSP